jgi:1-acyl-sn-glycerol-3-phosphate acyltransferase
MGSTTLRVRRLALYLAWTLILMPVQAIGLALRQPWVATFPRFYHRRCCRLLGFEVRQIGQIADGRPVLFASNHVSYTDIFVLGSLIAGSFVAKSEVATMPFFGWLAKLQRSIFVDRQVRSTIEQRDAIAARLRAKDALILFPEGTSGDGNFVLPFKSALFSVVFDRNSTEAVTVQPVSIVYTKLDGMPIGRGLRPFFSWYGDMDLAPHLWTLVGLGRVEVVVEFHPPASVAEFATRKALARFCHERVSAGFGRALAGREALTAALPPAQPEPAETELPAAAVG